MAQAMASQEAIILIEDVSHGGIVKASWSVESLNETREASERLLNQAMGTIRLLAERFTKNMREIEKGLTPDEAVIEFGLKLDFETGPIISPIAKANSGAQITVSFKWNIDHPKETQLLIKPNE